MTTLRKLLHAVIAAAAFSTTALAADFGSDVGRPKTPTVTAGAYSAGQAMGGLQQVAVFRGIDIPRGIFDFFSLLSKAGNTVGMTVYIFDTKPSASTTCTDTQSFVLAAGDMAKLAFAPFTITPAVPQNGTAAIGEIGETRSVMNQDSPPTQNLYICIVANGTVTPGSTSDLMFKIGVSQD